MTHNFSQSVKQMLDISLMVCDRLIKNRPDEWNILRQSFPDLEKGYNALQNAYAKVVKEDSE